MKPKVIQIIQGKKGSAGNVNASQNVDAGKIKKPVMKENKGQVLYKSEEGKG